MNESLAFFHILPFLDFVTYFKLNYLCLLECIYSLNEKKVAFYSFSSLRSYLCIFYPVNLGLSINNYCTLFCTNVCAYLSIIRAFKYSLAVLYNNKKNIISVQHDIYCTAAYMTWKQKKKQKLICAFKKHTVNAQSILFVQLLSCTYTIDKCLYTVQNVWRLTEYEWTL